MLLLQGILVVLTPAVTKQFLPDFKHVLVFGDDAAHDPSESLTGSDAPERSVDPSEYMR